MQTLKALLISGSLMTQFNLLAQAPCSYFQQIMDNVKRTYQAQQYDQAIQHLQAARACDPVQEVNIDRWYDRVFAAIQQQEQNLEIERNNAQDQRDLAQKESNKNARNSRANSNALAALKLSKTDHQKALRLAELNYLLYPENATAAGLFKELYETPLGNYFKNFQKGHTSEVWSVAFAPDGQSILTGSRDNTAKLWDLKGHELQSFQGHTSYVWSVAFALDGQSILTGSRDKTAKLWDLKGHELQSFQGHTSYVWSVAFAPDGQSILTGSRDNTAKLWDLKGHELQSFQGHTSSV